MKKISLLAIILLTAACGQRAEAPAKALTPLLDGQLLPAYMKVLPLVLKESERFIASPEGKRAANNADNTAFYSYLYSQPEIAASLREAGFAGADAFGAHHELVVAVFITLTENPEILKEAKTSLPSIQKELDALILKQGRNKNNSSLNDAVVRMQDQAYFYSNLIILAPYSGALQKLNSPS